MKNNPATMKKEVSLLLFCIFLISCTPEQQTIGIPVPDVEDPSAVEEMIVQDDTHQEEIQDEVTKRESHRATPCTGGRITFNHPPVNLEQIEWIVPLGLMSAGHVTPVDHQYYQAAHNNQIEVTSPGDGTITTIERMGPASERREDWRLIIQHTCTIESIYIHIDKLSPKLAAFEPTTKRTTSVSIPIEAGEIIGWYDHNVDYNVVDQDITLGLINLESFSIAEDWKPHVQDPFLYFNEDIQQQLIALSLRDQEPYGGKIDYDIDGKLIGMWFEEGTNGYAGLNFPSEAYHQGHLAIAPDHLDPSYTIVSLGTYDGDTNGFQFGIQGENLNPAEIGLDQQVKWELTDTEYFVNGNRWDRQSLAKGIQAQQGPTTHGVVLLKLLENRKLKVETFPNKQANQVTEFTQNAKIYNR
jgi:hypothetical protein